MSSYTTVTTEMLLLLFGLLSVSLLSPRVLISFLSCLGGAPKIDLPLVLGGTKIVVLAEAILGEEKSYPKSVLIGSRFLKTEHLIELCT